MMESGYRTEEIAEAEAELARLQAAYDLLLAGTRQEEIDEAAAKVAGAARHRSPRSTSSARADRLCARKAVVEVISVRPGDIAAPNHPVVRCCGPTTCGSRRTFRRLIWGRSPRQEGRGHVRRLPRQAFRRRDHVYRLRSEFTPRNVQTIDERRHQVFGFKVRVDDPQGVFKSGMAAEVFLPLSSP